MSRKNKERNSEAVSHSTRAKGNSRADLVLRIVETDNTFELQESKDKDIKSIDQSWWIGKCIHCNSRLRVEIDGTTDATVEHIYPLSAGGTNDLLNLSLACTNCNNEKGIRHDAKKLSQRAEEIIDALLLKRCERTRNSKRIEDEVLKNILETPGDHFVYSLEAQSHLLKRSILAKKELHSKPNNKEFLKLLKQLENTNKEKP